MHEKNLALASLDVRIIRAQAERRQRLERRVQRITRLYPDLRLAPLEAREDLVFEASRRALRGWPAYATGLLAAATMIAPFYAPARAISGLNAFELAVALLILMAVPCFLLYLRVRAHVKRAVENLSHRDNASTPDT